MNQEKIGAKTGQKEELQSLYDFKIEKKPFGIGKKVGWISC